MSWRKSDFRYSSTQPDCLEESSSSDEPPPRAECSREQWSPHAWIEHYHSELGEVYTALKAHGKAEVGSSFLQHCNFAQFCHFVFRFTM